MFDFDVDEFEFKVRIKVSNYSPGRPAPHASSPDSPKWADPGDPEEIEWEAFFLVEKKEKKDGVMVEVEAEIPVPPEVCKAIESDVETMIREESEEIEEGRMNEAAEQKYDEAKDNERI